MSQHTTPSRRYTPGQTPVSARRLNEVGDQLSRTARDQRTFSNKYAPVGRWRLPRPLVISNCTTGTAGVVKVKRSTAPGSTTAQTGAVEQYAWLGTDAFSTTGMALWGIPIKEKAGTLDCVWLILDMAPGMAHWHAPCTAGVGCATKDELSTSQDNPDAIALCDG